VGTRCADHMTPLYPQKLALTSPSGGGRSVGIVRSRTKATEFSLVLVSLFSGNSRRMGETIERPQASQGTTGSGQITHVLRRIRFSDANVRLDFWSRGCSRPFYICFVEMSYASSLIFIPAGLACGCVHELEGHSRDAWRRVVVDREVPDHPCSGNSCEA
jgi:hypothetical protein